MRAVTAAGRETLARQIKAGLAAADCEVETLNIDLAAIDGGVGAIPVEKVWIQAFSTVGWLALLNNSFTTGGGPMVAYRLETFAGAGQGEKEWGRNLAPRAEAAAFVEGQPTLRSRTVNSYKQGYQFDVNKEALVDVHRLRESLINGAAYGLALDTALQVVNGNGTTQGEGIREYMADAARVNRRVQIGAGAPTPDNLEAAYKLVPPKARMDPSCAWLTSDDNAQAILKATRDTRYVQFTRRAEELGAAYELMGKPLFEAPGFPDFAQNQAVTAVFGPLSSVAARYVVPPRIVLSDDGEAFNTDEIRVKVTSRFDCRVIDELCLAVLSGS